MPRAAANSPAPVDIGNDANGRFLNLHCCFMGLQETIPDYTIKETSFSRNSVQVSKNAGENRLLFTHIQFAVMFFNFL